MIVVSDTSPITSLMTVGRIELLEKLYRSVVIPSAVAVELARTHPQLPGFITVHSVGDEAWVQRLALQLDRGEAEAIVLAKELHAEVLLMDEALGRSVAASEGLRTVGVAGVLLAAKKRGYISSVGEIIEQLDKQAHFFLARAVREHTLRLAGESKE